MNFANSPKASPQPADQHLHFNNITDISKTDHLFIQLSMSEQHYISVPSSPEGLPGDTNLPERGRSGVALPATTAAYPELAPYSAVSIKHHRQPRH